MKKLILFFLILIPALSFAQNKKQSFGQAYAGIMLHDLKQPGGSLVGNFGINKYVGIGAGLDVTAFDVYGGSNNKVMVPVYADLRFRFPVKEFIPFVVGQFGKQMYSKKGAEFTDFNGAPNVHQQIDGRYFFGGGVGVSFKIKGSGIGPFIEYLQRSYKFSFSQPNYPTYQTDFSVGVVTAGITF